MTKQQTIQITIDPTRFNTAATNSTKRKASHSLNDRELLCLNAIKEQPMDRRTLAEFLDLQINCVTQPIKNLLDWGYLYTTPIKSPWTGRIVEQLSVHPSYGEKLKTPQKQPKSKLKPAQTLREGQ